MGHPERLFDDLPSSLQVEMALHLNRPILARVPLFKGAGQPVLRELVRHLRPAVFTPGDAILQRGDPGRRIFFIHRGAVEVLGHDETSVIATLSDGDFFGEMALLENQPRTATVRAIDYCDLYTLDRAQFEEVLTSFPEFARKIRLTAEQRRAGSGDD
jgi:voltage-gated potassium channel